MYPGTADLEAGNTVPYKLNHDYLLVCMIRTTLNTYKRVLDSNCIEGQLLASPHAMRKNCYYEYLTW